MRVLVLGSIPGAGDPATEEQLAPHQGLIQAGRQIGAALATAGHRILIGSDNPRSIDLYVAEGIDNAGSAPGGIELHYPATTRTPFSGHFEGLSVARYAYHNDVLPPHSWTVAHVGALEQAELVVTLGGGFRTRVAANIALEFGRPVLPIATFGGTSAEVFQRAQYRIGTPPDPARARTVLVTDWTEESAAALVALVDEVSAPNESGPHTYFLSYAWDDVSAADHVEMLLRRAGRVVVRDESGFNAGGDLADAVVAGLGGCHTFIGLWSENYATSSWCPNELEFAIDELKACRLVRVVLVTLDETSPRLRAYKSLRLDGSTREGRDLAVRRLVEQEETPKHP